MELDEALDILEGGKTRIYETPLGTKLSVSTPDGEVYQFTREGLDAAKAVANDYEDVAVAVYEAENDEERGRIISNADVEEAWKVVGAVENISLTEDEARQLAD